jgi:hypothetical protein
MACSQSDRIDKIHERALTKEILEVAEKKIGDALGLTSLIEGHTDTTEKLQCVSAFLDVSKKIANGEDVSMEDMMLVLKTHAMMENDENKVDDRKEVSLPDGLFIHASTVFDMTSEEASWKSVYVGSFIEPELVVFYDESKKNGAIRRRDFAIQQLDMLKIPYVLRGQNNCQLDVSNGMRVREDQSMLAKALYDIFTHVFDVKLGKSTERSIVVYREQDTASIQALTKLGYLVDANRDRTIITM